MHFLTENKRKSALIAVIVVTVLLCGLGLTAYYYVESADAVAKLQNATIQQQELNNTIQQVISTAPNASFTLKYRELQSKNISNNVVTYLFGYIQADNLTELYFPSTMALNFNVIYKTNGTAQVFIKNTALQKVELVKGIKAVELPFGIYPIRIMNAQPGEVITFSVTLTAEVNWTPVDVVIAREQVVGEATLRVVS